MAFREALSTAFKSTALYLFEKYIEVYAHSPLLLRALSSVLETHMKSANKEAYLRIRNLLLQESRHPMTENQYLMDTVNKIRDERTRKKDSYPPTGRIWKSWQRSCRADAAVERGKREQRVSRSFRYDGYLEGLLESGKEAVRRWRGNESN